jgi:hypothetical protein
MGLVSKRDGKERMREIRALLMEWDAIGVADVPEAADEYDCMIGPLHGHLQRGADARSLRDWIARERVDHFGLIPNTGADSALADALVEWWAARSTRE